MKNKLPLPLMALFCVIICAFGFIACGGNKAKKAKNETQLKQEIADTRKSDKIRLFAKLNKNSMTAARLLKPQVLMLNA